LHLNQFDKIFSKPAGYTTRHCEVAEGLTMRVFVCLGFLLAANAASAQTTTTTVERSSHTVTTTGGRTTTSQTTSHSTYVTTVNRPRRYQPVGSGAYNPMGY
jgi:hypothetical protein